MRSDRMLRSSVVLCALLAIILTLVPKSFQEISSAGASRRALRAESVSVGFGKGFTYSLPGRGSDALPFFKQAMAKLKARKGGTLTIGPGTFIFSYQWEINASNLHIKGAGMGKSILKLGDNARTFDRAGFLFALSVKNVTMSDLTVDGNKANQPKKEVAGRYCILMADYRKWTFRRMECRNFQEYGFDPHGVKEYNSVGKFDIKDKRNKWSYDLVIEDCVSHDNGWDGFTVDMTIGVLLRNNTSYNNGRHGFNIVTASSQVVVENNRAYNNGFAPPAVFACGLLADTNQPGFVTNNVTFRNNKVDGQKGTGGACIKGAKNILFVNNEISNSVTCGTFAKPDTGIQFRNNRCIKNKQPFAYQGTGAKVTLVGNVFK